MHAAEVISIIIADNVTGIAFEDGSGNKFNYQKDGGSTWHFIDITDNTTMQQHTPGSGKTERIKEDINSGDVPTKIPLMLLTDKSLTERPVLLDRKMFSMLLESSPLVNKSVSTLQADIAEKISKAATLDHTEWAMEDALYLIRFINKWTELRGDIEKEEDRPF
jgi:hypothetical protein